MSEQQPPAGQPPEQPEPTPQPAPNAMPPGYPPPGAMPPPGYGSPPSYGTLTPPGYPAYSQGYYYPPGFVPVYVPPPPPREYAVPPAQPGLPWQIIPPAQGTLFQAWVSVGTRLSRQNIASWAQASKKGWTAWSIGVYITLTTLPLLAFAIVGAITSPSIAQNIAMSSGQTISASDLHALQTGIAIAAGVIVAIAPLLILASLYTVVFFWALFMPKELGTLRERMSRAIKPYALTLPAVGLLLFIGFSIGVGFFAYILSTVNFSPLTANTPQIPSILVIAFPISFLFATAVNVYTISLLVQSGSVGTTLIRWAVFGIDLLAGFALEIAIYILILIASFIVGIIIGITTSHPSGLHLLLPMVHAAVSMLGRI